MLNIFNFVHAVKDYTKTAKGMKSSKYLERRRPTIVLEALSLP
jgi:hypothetical protein